MRCRELERSTNQIENLINHARQENKLPFYLFYSNPDRRVNISCGYYCRLTRLSLLLNNFPAFCYCLILVSALRVKSTYDNYCTRRQSTSEKRPPISKYDLVNGGNPFLCLFCCPIAQGYNPSPIEHLANYLEMYYNDLIEGFEKDKAIRKEMPRYVEDIINGELPRKLQKLRKLENDKERKKKLEDILKEYRLIYKTKKGEDWLIKRVLIIDLKNE